MREKPESLDELLRQIDRIKDLNRHRKRPVYVCVVVEEQYFDELSKFVERYGSLGHSFDRKHIYLSTNRLIIRFE